MKYFLKIFDTTGNKETGLYLLHVEASPDMNKNRTSPIYSFLKTCTRKKYSFQMHESSIIMSILYMKM